MERATIESTVPQLARGMNHNSDTTPREVALLMVEAVGRSCPWISDRIGHSDNPENRRIKGNIYMVRLWTGTTPARSQGISCISGVFQGMYDRR